MVCYFYVRQWCKMKRRLHDQLKIKEENLIIHGKMKNFKSIGNLKRG